MLQPVHKEMGWIDKLGHLERQKYSLRTKTHQRTAYFAKTKTILLVLHRWLFCLPLSVPPDDTAPIL